MNKKVLALLSSVVLTAGMLVGCGSKGMKDGSYKSEFDAFDDHGWKGQVEITVADGKITDAKFDYVNESGDLKSKDAEYQEKMTQVSGIGPVEFSAQYAEALVEKQDPATVDAITGATTSGDDFKLLADAAVQYANDGKTETAVVKAKK
ncbi:FMN-binding protein [Clostridium sp. UBA7503]|uniref:FMN-binding protein n=1 Tax=Clostridium sp. UBA7503 TaxID=1946377 RepID=UPI0032163FA5